MQIEYERRSMEFNFKWEVDMGSPTFLAIRNMTFCSVTCETSSN